MKMLQIKEMSSAELNSSLSDLAKEKFNLKVQAKTGQLQNSARIKQVKSDIARIKTELTARNKTVSE
ncbi:MAG: 50S ribosomal protein L29 [Victivallales bacterium]|nr:50S ribosomal protein L29 [Victivallales bacterium]MCF7889193.1 50S ribosomal protein L29 [Victivallales bacterium]